MSNSLQPHTVHGILQARIMEWVAFPFSKRSSQPRDRTQVSHVAGRFFTSCATREAQEYWSGFPIPSPADLPDPGIKPGSPALQVNSLPRSYQGSPYRDPQNLAVQNNTLTISQFLWLKYLGIETERWNKLIRKNKSNMSVILKTNSLNFSVKDKESN